MAIRGDVDDACLPNKPVANVPQVFTPYITDNPYRLLALRSSASKDVLREKSNAVTQAFSAGLPGEVGLQEDFGVAEMPNLAAIVDRVWDDPCLLTLHRMMWLYEQDSPPNIEQVRFHQPKTIHVQYRREMYSRPWFVQGFFLSWWFALLRSLRWEALEEALSQYVRFITSDKNRLYLEALLTRDGKRQVVASEAVCRAQKTLTEHVVSQAHAFVADVLHGTSPSAEHHINKKIREFEATLEKGNN